MKTIILSILIAGFLQFSVLAQGGYSIQIAVPQLTENSTVFLAYYYGETTQLADSALTDKHGDAVFSGNEKLPGGMYIVVLPKQKHFELLIADEQSFRIQVNDTADIVQSISAEGSRDNRLLYEYQLYLYSQQIKFSELQKRLEQNAENPDSVELINRAGESLEAEVAAHWQALAEEHTETFFSTVLRAMNSGGNRVSQFGWFFDNVDFSDQRLLRTPIIHKHIRYLLARNLNANMPPEFIIQEIEQLLKKTQANQAVYDYTASYLLNFFNSFQRIGMNKVFVYIAENHILNGRAGGYSEVALESIAERNAELRAGFVGALAPELTPEAITGDTVSLHAITKPYTLLYFWSTGCGHCETATESIKNFMISIGYENVEVVSFYTKDRRSDWEKAVEETNMQHWKNVWDKDHKTNFRNLYYVVSTPLLYVLDKEKKIIGFRAGDGPILDLLHELEHELR